jgi:hypothetical protein
MTDRWLSTTLWWYQLPTMGSSRNKTRLHAMEVVERKTLRLLAAAPSWSSSVERLG